ncbi:MAG: Single-stranded-DNA-specific exonuclease RecJ [Candidatus Woesebacteria bacterium GW2011_GWA1_33_30]|uniref:Single-stranded-DNA-specific exonuclease RecJ n=1 Tax=Candidatus Woesebacteria bacterium GW2011_GWA2_33_28 TaxID=1618561 RepID=A0A0F9ZTW0_9BACT|nr:MAG: Single-stranded-DNA-specific exonuclease RecJ [Candidatus Woesebacteria bacterium GW2011_GWA2_33_28]KKP48625.1 MAG: Single-stranded-DNA-specific exonuclease RecJ [Candidatus Woesebacteria bacterium GW2011_GWA1_33_30]KKP49764.1 MAG: Single-stranded-DNA-specific exonuclease RecJ [Microgenomates group bacterium GW2011_GWC1_33_32]KKP52381.1 MAG: Single-stranded-DNA-specific exonuclease RecJ [Candidatus Woesebacteria bacterium GW2011_GWB1_33_38]KKP57111.1 MAG: Single-stranded-DNA-specific ex
MILYQSMKWQILSKGKDIIKELLKNRNIKTKKEIDEFLQPKNPAEINIQELGIGKEELEKVIKKLQTAKDKKEKIVVFGDYDCDGVCATAILWETLYKLGFDAMPYIPDRFEEGYGFKTGSLEKLQNFNPPAGGLNPKLIITVDNGIVAYDAIDEAQKREIDVIVVDHHTKGDKKLSTSYILHSTAVCGSALAWFLSRELSYRFGTRKAGSEPNRIEPVMGLDFVALGTVADQMQLLGINRSLVKYGLEDLQKTKRVGLKALIKSAGLDKVGVYEAGYILAPRINAMGRLSHALDSLRLLCTRDTKKAETLAKVLSETNIERQKIVDDVLVKAIQLVTEEKVVVIEGDYHEGVIGLASGKITEKLYRPSIVLSHGEKVSKASARSISGFNIIEAIKETGLILEGGGHPMAAGFSIETSKISEFRTKINKLSQDKLTDEILEKKLKIDLELDFENIDNDLVKALESFEPTGYGNFSPVFMTEGVKVVEIKPVGSDGKHLKLKLSQNGIVFDAIWFSFSKSLALIPNSSVNVAYTIETNTWNNHSQTQLKVKDIKT